MSDEIEPYRDLIRAVIESGVKDKDIEYFNSETFEMHCLMLGVDSNIMRNAILQRLKSPLTEA